MRLATLFSLLFLLIVGLVVVLVWIGTSTIIEKDWGKGFGRSNDALLLYCILPTRPHHMRRINCIQYPVSIVLHHLPRHKRERL